MTEINDMYCRIPVPIIKKYAKQIPFDLFIRLSDSKIIKISNSQEEGFDMMDKYQNITDIFGKKEQYREFLKTIKEELSICFSDPKTTPQEQMELLGASHQLVRESFKKIGVSEAALDLAKTASDQALHVIKEYRSIAADFFIKFCNISGYEYTKAVLISYMASCILDGFDWSSEAIKRKVSFAIMLRDITLSPEDFSKLEEYETSGNQNSLSKDILGHPNTISNLLDDSKKWGGWVSQDILTIIKQHHENPNGTGFPNKATNTNIIQLSAIEIVADKFVSMLIKEKFDPSIKCTIISKLSELYPYSNFKKAIAALNKALDIK